MALKTAYDAIVVGSGPNGLAAAITLQHEGLTVLLVEAKDTIGGGLRTAELTLPGFMHDVCSAVHPMAVASPFFQQLPLEAHGLEFIYPAIAAAHPFDDGSAAALYTSLDRTAAALGTDEKKYRNLIEPVLNDWPLLAPEILGPLRFPKHPFTLASFGIKALAPASLIANSFSGKAARGLWAGMAAHAIQPLSNIASAAVALVLLTTGHFNGWPVPRGGSQSIAKALAAYFISIGGEIQTGFAVEKIEELPAAQAVLFDVSPKQLFRIAGHKFSANYNRQITKFRYGMGVFKIDWALNAPIPFSAIECRQAGTVHLGNTFEEIATGERLTSQGKLITSPFVLLAQQSLVDDTRAPQGRHTAWAYCHVPNGSTTDMTAIIENQVERFAPGFRDTILERHTMDAVQMESYNPNYVGGDINGGISDIRQLYTRPVVSLSPYNTPAAGIYICSASTPPGGGVHGMCGYHAARRALKDVFELKSTIIPDTAQQRPCQKGY